MNLKNNLQLFLLHFSGGNVFSFQFLKPYLPINFDFHPIELPGRGKRVTERLLSTELEAIDDLVSQIISLRNNQPYLVFGHSMGATLGLRVTKRLEEAGDPPERLIVAGNPGPGIIDDDKCRSMMTDEELKEELKILGGISDEALDNPELFNFFAPILRSDFKLLENSEKLSSDFKINSPIVAVMGDQEDTSEKINNWKNFTSSKFKSYLLPGNHFFIHYYPSNLIQIISDRYDRPVVP